MKKLAPSVSMKPRMNTESHEWDSGTVPNIIAGAATLHSCPFSEAPAKCAHVPDAKTFLSPYGNHRMPCVVLHELAHGFHDQTIGFADERVTAVWKKFCEGGKY